MPLDQWTKLHNSVLLPTGFLALALNSLIILPLYFLFSYLYLSMTYKEKSQLFSWANLVTLLRWALLIPAINLSSFHLQSLVFLLFLLLDGADGYVARRSHQQSDFGASFDMELDSLGVLIMSILVYKQGEPFSSVFLGVGFARPLATIIKAIVWPRAFRERRSPWGRIIFVLLWISLILKIWIPDELTTALLLCSSGLIIGSFALDFIFFSNQANHIKIDPSTGGL